MLHMLLSSFPSFCHLAWVLSTWVYRKISGESVDWHFFFLPQLNGLIRRMTHPDCRIPESDKTGGGRKGNKERAVACILFLVWNIWFAVSSKQLKMRATTALSMSRMWETFYQSFYADHSSLKKITFNKCSTITKFLGWTDHTTYYVPFNVHYAAWN